MKYHAPMRRRARALRRAVQAAAQPAMWRGGRVIPAFWWDGHPNFGDDMTPWLLPHYGILPRYRRASEARLAGVGSILEFLPPSFDGAIWGSGLMTDVEHPLPDARVLAVRGPLTAERIGVKDTVPFGDAGLLMGRLLRRPKPRWEIGIVPHGHHRGHPLIAKLAREGGDRVRVVNVHQGAAAASREIAACSIVLTSSLHGLVVADAFGIPAVWTVLEPALHGGDFKFHDYEAGLTPGRSRFVAVDERFTLEGLRRHVTAVDAAAVRQVSSELEGAILRYRTAR